MWHMAPQLEHMQTHNTMPSKKQRAKQAKAVKRAKSTPFPAMVKTIRAKWHEQGYFLRFKDGDRGNCCLDNLELCAPHDAFLNPEWAVDWDMSLTQEEIDYVKAHMSNFAKIYE